MNKGERTREIILNRGMLHSSKYGIADITIGSISKLCGLSRTGVISHFKNKDDMQIAILEYSETQFVSKIVKPSRKEDAADQLEDLLMRWIDWTERLFDGEVTSCPFIKAIVEYENRLDSPVRQYAIEQQQRLISFMTMLVKNAQEQGRFVDDISAEETAVELYSLYVGVTTMGVVMSLGGQGMSRRAILKRGLYRFHKVQ
jgi:AcrR family transcriptional regulator